MERRRVFDGTLRMRAAVMAGLGPAIHENNQPAARLLLDCFAALAMTALAPAPHPSFADAKPTFSRKGRRGRKTIGPAPPARTEPDRQRSVKTR